MAYSIYLTPSAEDDLDIIVGYLLENWSEKRASKFLDDVDQTLELIKIFPEAFPESPSLEGIRKSVLRQEVSVFYRIKNQEIQILRFFDTRQSPSHLFSSGD